MMEPVSASTALAVAKKGAVQALEKDARGFIKAVLGEPAKALGGLLTDKVNRRRHANLVKITADAKHKLVEAGLSPKEVPLTIIHPALEAASLEEDPQLQETWANLLANSADPRDLDSVAPSFVVILKELRSREVRFLEALYSHAELLSRRPYELRRLTDIAFRQHDLLNIYANAGLSRQPQLTNITVKYGEDHKEDFVADYREFTFTRELVTRLSILSEVLLTQVEKLKSLETSQSGEIIIDLKHYQFSTLGACFVRACRKPEGRGA
jgi:Abortive infection alpha